MSDNRERSQMEGLIARLFAEVTDTKKALAAVQRAQDTKHTVLMPGESIQSIDEDGNVIASFGDNPSGNALEVLGGPDPATPEAPEVDAQEGQFTVIVDGLDEHGDLAPTDLQRTRVHYSRDPEFSAYEGTFKGAITGARGQKTFGISAGNWYVAVQWETRSGKLSDPSAVVAVEVDPPVNTDDLDEVRREAQDRIDQARDEAQPRFEALEEGLDEHANRLTSAESDLADAHERIDATEAGVAGARDEAATAQAAADKAIADALAAANLADGKGEVIVQVSKPTGARATEQNLWVRLPDLKVHYYDGNNWVEVTDPDLVEAAQEAAEALTEAQNATAKANALELALDGPGGIRARLEDAETLLGDKADSDDLAELNEILRGAEDLPPEVANKFYAGMAIIARLQAVTGWIGNVNLADGAVTAEKITATRELITHIMGAEWAYIAEQLVVDGSILTRDLEALSAAIQSLTVTQRADIAQLWADQIWTALAVIEELQAEEAWITSAMISELTAEKVTVTEEFVSRIGTFAEILGDELWANTAFIDRMAASDAYFGSEDADQQTYIDGTGMTINRRDPESGEFVPAIRIGGGEFSINAYSSETGEPTGGITSEGDVTGRNVQAQNYSLAGRDIFGDPENYHSEIPIFDTLPKGERAKGYANMNGRSWTTGRFWGFLELEPFYAEPGRAYNVALQPFRMGDTKTYFMSFNYTVDGSSPWWGSPQAALFTQAGNTFSGSFRFESPTAGLVRMIVYVYAGSTGITFNTSGSEVRITVYDEGLASHGIGFLRNATNTDPDPQPLVRDYNSAWPITWWQNYGNGNPGYEGFRILYGQVGGTNVAASMWGYQGSLAFAYTNSEAGRTMPQALSGAELNSGNVTLRGHATSAASQASVRLYWHTNTSAPATFGAAPAQSYFVGEQVVRHATATQFQLPEACLNAIRNETFGGFSVHPGNDPDPYFGIGAGTGASSPVLRLQYTR